MFRKDSDGPLPLTGGERELQPFHSSSNGETDSSLRTPLLKNLLRKDIIGFMSRFFVNRFPS